MATNLAANPVEEAPERDFPYSNWGPWVAVLGVVLALGVGVVVGIPALVLGQEQGKIEKLEPPSYGEGSEVDSAEASAISVAAGTGVLYADRRTSVAVLGPSGKPLDVAGFGEFEASYGIDADDRTGRVYVSDRDGGTVSAFVVDGGRPRFLFDFDRDGLPAEESAGFEPAQLAVDGSRGPNGGDVYVIDRASDVVDRFSPSGSYLGQLDGSASPAGGFDFSGPGNANGIVVDGSDGPGAGNVYVVAEGEGDSGTVWAFDQQGEFLWEMPGRDDEDLCGVAIDPSGRLWLADAGGGATEYASRESGRPPAPTGRTAATGKRGCGLAFDGSGALFAAEEFEGELTTPGNVGVQIATALAFLLVPMALVAWRGAAGRREIFARLGLRGFRPSALKWMAAAVGAYLLFAIPYSLLVVEPKQEDIAEGFGALPVQILLIAVAAPVAEEICFRGMLFGGLRERLPRILAALIAGAIFGVLHAFTGLSAVPPLIAFGFVLCLLYEKTGSIVPGILLHMLNNSVALLTQ